METMRILRKTIILALCLVLCGAMIPAAGEKTGEKKRISSPEEAELFVRTFLGENPELLDRKYLLSEMMEQAVYGSGGFSAIAKQFSALGELHETAPAYAGEISGMKVFRVPCRFSMAEMDIVLTLDGDGAIAGLVTDRYTGPAKTEKAEGRHYSKTELFLPVPELNGELPGTLTMPEGEGPFPAVVLIHGSGPNDRDESIGALKPFRDIAEDLSNHGIAVYRFDKRTLVYGKEMAADTKTTLREETVLDAVRAVQLLAAQDQIDPERIFVLGHSLGGTAIPAIDLELKNQTVKARGYILMAPGARRLDTMIRDQYDFLAELMPEAKSERNAVLAELEKLEKPETLQEGDIIAGAYAAYWKWLIEYDPAGMAADITVPCLLMQGEEDYQVSMEDFRIFRNALGGKENWTFRSYPGLVHTFTEGKKTEGPAAYTRSGRVSERVTADIAEFILTQ